jgi:hypothetical protein
MRILLIAFIICGTAQAQNVVLSWSSFSSASGVASSGNIKVAGSGGESFAGVSANGNTMLASGFIAGLAGQSFITSVQEETALPAAFELYQNYPNPFNPSTTIRYDVPWQSRVTVVIYNLLGQSVALLADDEKSPGRHSLIWHGRNDDGAQVATGVYFYRIHAERLGSEKQSFVQTRKLVLVR